MKRFERYKKEGHVYATAMTLAFGKVTAYENLTHGNDARMVVFDAEGRDVSDEFDSWDTETFYFIANDL